jgi:hypothetical protein
MEALPLKSVSLYKCLAATMLDCTVGGISVDGIGKSGNSDRIKVRKNDSSLLL